MKKTISAHSSLLHSSAIVTTARHPVALAAFTALMLWSSSAAAQATCDLNGTNSGSNAAVANGGATATGTDALACGENATASQAGGVAIGEDAQATGPSDVNPMFASTAVGYQSQAQDNGVAIGQNAVGRFSGTVAPANIGINSGTAIGSNAVAIGSNTVAIGSTSRAGSGFTVNTPNSPVSAASNATAVGGHAEVNANNGTAIGAFANVTAVSGTALGVNSNVTAESGTALGANATTSQAGGVAIGEGAQSTGPSATDPRFASTAVGYQSQAHDNGVAIGQNAVGRFSGTVAPVNIGINSGTAIGSNAVAIGSNTVAIGSTARAGTGFILNSPSSPVSAAFNATAVGGHAEVNANNGTAIGANANVTAELGTALGTNALASHTNAVAIGAGSTTSADNTVSVGSAGSERRITNVANGTAGTDAVNLNQLQSNQAAMLGAAQSYADAGDARTLSAAQSYADAGNARTLQSANQYTDAQLGVLRKEAFAGIAQAAALVPMAPSGEGETTLNVGVASYGGQAAIGVAFARQIGSVTINGGVALSGGKHNLVRVGAGWRF